MFRQNSAKRNEYAIGKALDELNLASAANVANLRRLADLTIETAELQMSWYDWWENVYLWLSNITRFAGVFLLGVAVLVPLLLAIPGPQVSATSAVDNASRLWWLSIGYASAALAGLLLSIDRFFLLTESWGRFSLMTTTLGSKVTAFRYDCQKFFVGIGDGTVPSDKAREFIDSCKKFLLDVNNDVVAETKEWRTSLNEAVKALAERVGKSAEESQKRYEEARRLTSTGDLLVRISGVNRGYGEAEVLVDREKRGKLSEPNWETLIENLTAGPHTVSLQVKKDEHSGYELTRKVVVKGAENVIAEFSAREVWRKGTLRIRLRGGGQTFGTIKCKIEEPGLEHNFENPNWQFDFIDVPAGNLTVSVTGHDPNGRAISRTEQVHVAAGELKEWEFELPR